MLSNRIREARLNKKLTQEQLAKIVGTKKATISNYENRHSTPSNQMLSDLASALNVTSDYLLGLVDTPEGFTIDYSKAFNPFDVDGAIHHFINLLLAEGPFSGTIETEVFKTIPKIMEIHNVKNDKKIYTSKINSPKNEQISKYLCEINDIPFKLNLIEDFKK